MKIDKYRKEVKQMLIHLLPMRVRVPSYVKYRKKEKKPKEYTEREKKIINGEYVSTLIRGDITKLLNKATDMKDEETLTTLHELYDEMMRDENYYMPKDMKIISGDSKNVTSYDIANTLNKAVDKGDYATVAGLEDIYDINHIDTYYSKYEKAVIRGECAVPVGATTINRIMRKAEDVEEMAVIERLESLYEEQIEPSDEVAYTLKEAVDILHKLDLEYEQKRETKPEDKKRKR